jgi:hypothetical protein
MAKSKKEPQLDIKSLLAELEQTYRIEEQAYQDFVESIQGHDRRTKADEWMAYTAQNINTYGDQEALVYRLSRGYECKEEIGELISDWKRAARNQIEECAKGISVHILETGETKREGGMPLSKASDVKNVSPYLLRNFWGGRDEQELSIDATMLRTVEWCDIGGFDEWWERLARCTREDIIQGGIDPGPGSFWLFSMSRSDYAIELMGSALDRALEAIELPGHGGSYPWHVLREWSAEGQRAYCSIDHLPYASIIVFANMRLRLDRHSSDMVKQATEILLKTQDGDGAWSYWADVKRPSVEASAMCIHALAFARPRGWERAVARASEWLWSKQERSGCWVDRASPDPVYLSVLVLDALDLADGKQSVTFGRQGLKRAMQATRPERRFKVALSFPGELRGLVEPVARLLALKIGPENVFYDRFYEAELARPNLDVYLQSIYYDESEVVGVFLCSDYAKKEWCGLEWRAVRDLIKTRRDADVILFRTDNSYIPGIFSIDGYIDATGRSSEQLADLILARLTM